MTKGQGEGLSLRPLAEESMQGKQAFISGAYRVVELGAPGHAGEHAEEVLQLCVRQGSVLVLPKHTESPGQAGPSPCQRGPCHTGHLPAVQHHRDAVNGSNRWQGGQSWASSQSLCLRDCQHRTTANTLWDCSCNQAGPIHAHPTALSCCSWHSWSQLSHSSLHQSSLAFQSQLSTLRLLCLKGTCWHLGTQG